MKVRIHCWRDVDVKDGELPPNEDDMADLIQWGIESGDVHFRAEEGEFDA